MKIYCPYENVSCLLCVAFWWKEAVFFASFRQFKPTAVPRPVVFQQVQTLCVHTNDSRLFYAWDAISFINYNNGGRARFSRQRASTRSPATSGRDPESVSQHFFSCDNGLIFSLFRWVGDVWSLSPAIGTCTRYCATTAESLEARSSEKEGRRPGLRRKESVAQGQPLQILVSERALCNFCLNFLWKRPIYYIIIRSRRFSRHKSRWSWCRRVEPSGWFPLPGRKPATCSRFATGASGAREKGTSCISACIRAAIHLGIAGRRGLRPCSVSGLCRSRALASKYLLRSIRLRRESVRLGSFTANQSILWGVLPGDRRNESHHGFTPRRSAKAPPIIYSQRASRLFRAPSGRLEARRHRWTNPWRSHNSTSSTDQLF